MMKKIIAFLISLFCKKDEPVNIAYYQKIIMQFINAAKENGLKECYLPFDEWHDELSHADKELLEDWLNSLNYFVVINRFGDTMIHWYHHH